MVRSEHNRRPIELFELIHHKLNFNFGDMLIEKTIWIYTDTNEIVREEDEDEYIYEKTFCNHCHKFSTYDGQDDCIKNLPSVTAACCGHGKEFNDLASSNVYATRKNGSTVRFHKLEDMKKYFRMEEG